MTKLHLPKSDFITLSTPSTQSNVLLIAEDGVGKTTFAVRFAPDPLAIINFDNRAAHAIYEADKLGKELHYAHIKIPIDIIEKGTKVQQACKASLAVFFRNFEIAINEPKLRTVVIDTGTELDELITLAARGHLGGAKDFGRSKDIINRTWAKIYKDAREECMEAGEDGPYSKAAIDLITKLKPVIVKYAKKMNVNPKAVAGAIADEYSSYDFFDKKFQDGALASLPEESFVRSRENGPAGIFGSWPGSRSWPRSRRNGPGWAKNSSPAPTTTC